MEAETSTATILVITDPTDLESAVRKQHVLARPRSDMSQVFFTLLLYVQ